ncbi:TPA: hypothetical protein ACH3X2_14253 [Trebouxia sp. C0005]
MRQQTHLTQCLSGTNTLAGPYVRLSKAAAGSSPSSMASGSSAPWLCLAAPSQSRSLPAAPNTLPAPATARGGSTSRVRWRMMWRLSNWSMLALTGALACLSWLASCRSEGPFLCTGTKKVSHT